MENQALQEYYKVYQQQHGHPNVDFAYSAWLAGSPDGLVSGPCGDDSSEHLGLVEI